MSRSPNPRVGPSAIRQDRLRAVGVRFRAALWTLATLAASALAPAGATASKPCHYQAFINDFVPRYPDYYAPEVFGDAAKMQARALRLFDPAQAAVVFPGVPPLTDERLAALSSIVGPQFVEQQRKFMRTFSDFNCDTIVEFGVSLLKFDGHPVELGGKHYLLFGVDIIAILHGPTDMPAFFDHEIFHLYHRQVVGSRAPQGEEPAWWTMWVEGLATYVSQRMNPGLYAQQILWYPRDMVPRMEQNRARAAQLMLHDIEKTGPDADRWFVSSTSVEGLPVRAGYYLGYLFAKSVGDGQPLPKLARKAPQQVHEEAVTFLTQILQTPQH